MTTTKEQRLASLNGAIKRGGGIIAFSRALGVAHQSVSNWRKRGKVPPDRALMIEQLFGVPRLELIDPALAKFVSTPEAGGDSIL